MGLFDGSGRFKTTQDGGWLFFPWGLRGSGYVIASEQDYERLRRQIKVSTIVTFVFTLLLTSGAAFLFSRSAIATGIITGIGSFLYHIPYSVWMRYLLPRLKVTVDEMPRQSWSAWLKALTTPDPPVPPAQKTSD